MFGMAAVPGLFKKIVNREAAIFFLSSPPVSV